MNGFEQVKVGTVKGHELAVGDSFNFHGMASDPIPTVEGTRVQLSKVGNKYMITTVYGEVMTWEFGATAKIWADTTVEHHVTTVARTLDNGDTVWTGRCEHGWMTGFHTSADDAQAVALGHGSVTRELYVAPVTQASEITPTPETLTPAMLATLGVLGGTDGSLHGGTTSGEVKAAGGNSYSLTKAMGLGWVVRREPVKGAAEKRNSPTYTITPEGATVLASQVITIPVGTSECACQDIWVQRQAGKILPDGGLCCPSDGSLFIHTDTEPSETIAAQSSQVIWANAERIHYTPDASDLAEGAAQAAHEQRNTVPSSWESEDIDIPTNAETDALMAEHDAAMGEWVKPLVAALPVRTPGDTLDAWQREESAIWAGTDQVVKMRFPRKLKKELIKKHTTRGEQWGIYPPRPIDRKRARVLNGAY
jgi:hypothetical protein